MDDTESAAAAAAAAAPSPAAEGSLPPRKRLLLKSNGAEGTPPLPPAMDSAATAVAAAAAPPPSDPASTDCCSRCGSKDNSVWRRVKKSGVYQRLCNTCTMLYSMNMFCPYCLLVYQDAGQLGDPEVWLNCNHCKRSVHVACEAKNAGDTTVDPAAYTCPECRKPKAEDPSPDGTPALKKPRVKTEGADAADDAADGKPAVPNPKPGAAQEALQAAKLAAQQAAKAAASAKATALAKAQAAAKAAMAAKAALDAAAQAARDEIDARAELRRNGVRFESRGYHALASAALISSPKLLEGGEKGKEESPRGDDELARQLHRAMNTSPGGRRMSPGASPSDAKQEKQQGAAAAVKEEHGLFQAGGDPGAVDTQGFPSTYLSDGGGAFPFDILAGFPSHEIQAGVIPGVTGVITTEAAMDVDGKAEGGDKAGVPPPPPEQDLADKTDTDVSFFGAADPKFEIPGKWNEDVKAEDDKQIAVEDYTMGEAAGEDVHVDVGKDEVMVDDVPAGGGDEQQQQPSKDEELQGTQTATASEAPDANAAAGTAVEKDLTV